MSMEDHGGLISAANSWFVYIRSQVILPAESSSIRSEGTDELFLSYFEGFHNMPLNLQIWGWRLYFPSERMQLQIFIVLKNPSPSFGLESANLGSNSKHRDLYTTKNDNWAPCSSDVCGSGSVAPHILNLDTRLRYAVSFESVPR
jgi:hypothetical protein